MNFLFFTIKLGCMMTVITSFSFDFERKIHCVMETSQGCVHWQSQLLFEKPIDASCFPENTYLQGTQNKIKISDLKVGDEVLVYSQQQGVIFEPIVAWLHREVDTTFQYSLIDYQTPVQGNSDEVIENGIYISGLHNIALVSNSTSKIEYTFAQNLKQGDSLFGTGQYLGSKTPKIVQVWPSIEKRGVYAPYTKSGNFFITGQQNSQELILVHCFAHVSAKYHSIFDLILSLNSQWSNVQPTENVYIHPLSSYLKDMFPSVLEMRTLRYIAQQHDMIIKTKQPYSNNQFRSNTHGTDFQDFNAQRQILVIIDKILSAVLLYT